MTPRNTTRMKRRDVLKAAAGLSMPSLALQRIEPTASAQARSRTFVLVHGAWHGGWCWGSVAEILRAQGHKVYAPSLSGLADRSHLLSTSITLDTHIADIVNLFQWEEIENAVLVGHSYGGWPISGAAERLVGKIASIVYVDAFVPENGQRGMDLSSAQFRKALQEAIANGEAGRPVPDANVFKIVEPSNVRWVQSKMTPQPTFVSTSPIALTGARDRIARNAYIRATGYPQPAFDGYLAAAKADRSWRTFELSARESGHDIMVDAPRRLAEILIDVS